jgi:hypothetical protein
MKNQEIKKMSLDNIENRLTPEEMEKVTGSGEGFGWGRVYSYGCIGGYELILRDYNVFWLSFHTDEVALLTC